MVRILLSLALAAMAVGQTPNARGQSAAPAVAVTGPPNASVASAEVVLTVHGACSGEAERGAQADSCVTVLTRADFERLMEIVGHPVQSTPGMRWRRYAEDYATLLAGVEAARKAGVENTPKFQESLRVLRMRVLSDSYRRDLQDQYRDPTQAEIDAIYQKDPSKYAEVRLRRLMVPRNNPAAANKEEYDKKALQVAGDMHDRAARGEDLDTLQKEAYSALGLNIVAPATDLGPRRKSMMPADEADEVFALKAGAVSKLEHEPFSYVTYKVDGTQPLSKEQIKSEISRELSKQKFDSAIQAVTSPLHAEFNPDYFGLESAPSASPAPGAPPK